jgi:hypothetical protein
MAAKLQAEQCALADQAYENRLAVALAQWRTDSNAAHSTHREEVTAAWADYEVDRLTYRKAELEAMHLAVSRGQMCHFVNSGDPPRP